MPFGFAGKGLEIDLNNGTVMKNYSKPEHFASYNMDKDNLADCTGVCIFWTGFRQYNPIIVEDHLRLIEYTP